MILMIIEILEQGGIYAYYLKDECIYVGKTTRPFSERDNEHKNGMSPFDKFYKQNPNLTLKILIDCSFCNISKEQLDYLETCFIQALNPLLNKNKINQQITYKTKLTNEKQENKDSIYEKLTKSEILIYEVIQSFEKSTITRKEILQSLNKEISSRTLDRAMPRLCELNVLILKHSNETNENLYEIVKK